MSGGACFSPQLNPRPTYPPLTDIFVSTATSYVRTSLIGAIAVVLVYPTYIHVVNFFMTRGFTEPVVFALFTAIVHSMFYIGRNLSFYLIRDYLEDYKFVRKASQSPSHELVKRTLVEAAIGQIISSPIITYLVYFIFKWFGMPSLDAPLPGFWQIAAGFAMSAFFNDFGFYWAHRAFHHPMLYGKFHKQHHSYIGTIGIAAEFASFPEQVFANQIPTIGGCLFFGCHGSPLIFWVWIAYRLWETYETHSGYCFYGCFLERLGLTNSRGAAYHDFHHTKNQGNFGSMLLDYLFGTMDSWVEMGGFQGYIEQYRTAEMNLKSEGTKKDT